MRDAAEALGIILATGVYMVLRNCVGTRAAPSVDVTATTLTCALAAIYFGSRRLTKKGISPIAPIGLSALSGILIYGWY